MEHALSKNENLPKTSVSTGQSKVIYQKPKLLDLPLLKKNNTERMAVIAEERRR
jgi:hypothetical protein